MARHLLTLQDLTSKEFLSILDLSAAIKRSPGKYAKALAGKSLIMLFQKTSTRTRLSFEVGMTQLGGHAVFVDWKTSNFTLGALQDETRCLARYGDIIMARANRHEDLVIMAHASSVPVINGLSDAAHPCQALADLLTIKEKLRSLKGRKVAFIGDGNNVCHSLMEGCALAGASFSFAGPKEYWPGDDVVKFAKKSIDVRLTDDPKEAVRGADVVYTDTWVSMGQEAESEKRLQAFMPYQVNEALLKESKALVMHFLPAHRGYEITDGILDSHASVVFDQAENRMHAQKALMLFLLGVKP